MRTAKAITAIITLLMADLAIAQTEPTPLERDRKAENNAPSPKTDRRSVDDEADSVDELPVGDEPEAGGEEPEAKGEEPDEVTPTEDDSGDDEDAVDIQRPPAKNMGAIVGVVTDPRTRETLVDAAITVTDIEGKGKREVVTDIDGKYRLELPPGTYVLRAFYDSYKPVRFDRIRVEKGKIVAVDLPLEADLAQALEEEVVVEAELTQSSVEGQLLKRQRSAQASDAIGRAEIAKTPDTNAAQAAQRVVGANIVDGRFVYVRGLGERYTNGLLNGSLLPSPEPDRAAVPLDVFPSQVLESVTISKTFTPDMPGDFAGGSVNVVTRDIPDKLLFSVTLTGGVRLVTTFHERYDYRGSGTDFMGFDNGMRRLPGAVPRTYRLGQSDTLPNGDPIPSEQRALVGRDINTYMTTQRKLTLPDHGVNMVIGNGWSLGAKRKLGAVAALSYSRAFLIRDEIRRDFTYSEDEPGNKVMTLDYRSTLGRESVRVGAYTSVAYSFDENHDVKFVGLFSQLSDDDTTTYGGFKRDLLGDIRATRLKFVSRNMKFAQLSGKHRFPEIQNSELVWNVSLSEATRYEPDTRDTVYNFSSVRNRWNYVDGQESGRHFWADQVELARGGGLDYVQPFGKSDNAAKLKIGGLVSVKNRSFRARRFTLRPTANIPGQAPRHICTGESLENDCVDSMFTSENIVGDAYDSNGLLYLQEGTRGSDAYDATLNVYSTYIMTDVPFGKRIRAIIGERVEVTRQNVLPANPLNIPEDVESARLRSTNLLPSATVVYKLHAKSNLRSTVSQTVARPQLRELAPFTYTNYFGGLEEQGNPGLKLTRIVNSDLRWEYYPSLREVVALSVFHKQFTDPIEPVLIPSGNESGIVTFKNSKNAQLVGVELESRKELGFLSKRLQDVSLMANVTFAWSRIGVEQTGNDFITNTRRPLVHQAPWVVNFGIDYSNETLGFDARALYNVTGPRISEVGANGLDDRYVQPRHIVDLVVTKKLGKHFAVRGIASDIFSSPEVVTVGKRNVDSNVTRRWVDGARFSVAATYNY